MKCSDKRCKTCPSIEIDEFILKCNNKDSICKTTGVVYMIICGVCNIRYIGQCSTPLNLRINNHRSLCNKVKINNSDVQSQYEYDHFKLHPFKHAKIRILDIVDDNNNRLERENYFILKYRSIYPYGLNDRVNNISITGIKDNTCVYKEVLSTIRFDNNRHTRIRSRRKINRFINFDDFLKDLDDAILLNNNVVGYIKGKILGLKCSKVKVLAKLVKDFEFKYYLIKDLVFDLIKFKLQIQNFLIDNTHNTFKSYLVVDFIHKYIDTLNISQILHNQDLISSFPVKDTYPLISYRYSPTLGSIAFNYTKFAKEIVIENIEQYHCECNNSIYKDEYHNHIVSGNLNILGDQELINIFKYGSKFRIIPRLNINEIIDSIDNSINDYIHKLSFRINVNIGHFVEWKNKFMLLIRNAINHTPNTIPCTTNIRRFRNKIKDIQDRFVIVPVDKAGNNFGFICKKYYAQILISEIDSSDTFELGNINCNNLKILFIDFMKRFNLIPSSKIPFIYCIPKFHKNPVKFRFITSSFDCINKDVSIILNLALDVLFDKIQDESESSWIIKNNCKVLNTFSHCNDNPVLPGNHMVATFDFSTLYTTLPHDDLIRCIVALHNKYIHSNIEVFYRNRKLIISRILFVEILKFSIKNSYVLFNNRLYRQKVGIPMGSNFSPNLANLYLHFYESQFLDRNHEGGRNRYKHSYRYIDDLLSVNNRDIIYDVNSIYPRFLEITNTNNNNFNKGSFLDIDIEVGNNRFLTKVYDKRREFEFEILGLPAFSSNVPNNMAYGVICSQFCRFANICMRKEDFLYNCQLVVDKIGHNGFPAWLLKKFVIKFKHRKNRTIAKFNLELNLEDHIVF